MKLYRIAKEQHIRDLTGTGARLYGGRWNHKGISLLYTSESRSLATLELLVHTSPALIPNDLSILEIEIPDTIKIDNVDINSLPKDWRNYTSPLALADIGSQWVQSN
ncbi:MAG: RES family NAD+ phosphorylase, partial [Candidatus Sericytochromatia bacterium]|nr:RES family NAD+ phosphorylase [Candidatus Sericytochromatia bacterium]